MACSSSDATTTTILRDPYVVLEEFAQRTGIRIMDPEAMDIMRRRLRGETVSGKVLPPAPPGKVHVFDITKGCITHTVDDD